jgi:hypothetical protein
MMLASSVGAGGREVLDPLQELVDAGHAPGPSAPANVL